MRHTRVSPHCGCCRCWRPSCVAAGTERGRDPHERRRTARSSTSSGMIASWHIWGERQHWRPARAPRTRPCVGPLAHERTRALRRRRFEAAQLLACHGRTALPPDLWDAHPHPTRLSLRLWAPEDAPTSLPATSPPRSSLICGRTRSSRPGFSPSLGASAEPPWSARGPARPIARLGGLTPPPRSMPRFCRPVRRRRTLFRWASVA